jgi:tRNA modification GTPase
MKTAMCGFLYYLKKFWRKIMNESTIAAIATPSGEGGIGIVRISGDKALEILEKVFVPFGKEIVERKLIYGHVVDKNTEKVVDEVMAVYMKSPHSYTTEDVVEIQCHGSSVSLRRILALALENGAVLADRGEFTKRAFLNGRIDLSQAEAVIDLIKAKSDKTFDVALSQLDGTFSRKIKEMRENLVDILVNLTVNIDYPDEDIEIVTYENLERDINVVIEKIGKLLKTSQTGKILRDGFRVSIVGKPNVGKSSLLNAILGENRAIVTDIPGTTRDTIEENISIKGIPVILTDTAGIRNTDDVIEKIGIEKSKKAFNDADLIIFVMDGSRELENEDLEIIDIIGNRKAIVLINKADKEIKISESDVKEKLPNSVFIKTVLKDGDGIDELSDAIESIVYDGDIRKNDNVLVTNVRHKNLLEESKKSLVDALEMTRNGEPLEFIEIDVNRCYDLLGEIIGETADSDIIDKVFERFCLGK